MEMILIGIFFHFIGGVASASFYTPFKKIKDWSWESYWIVGGLASWLIIPLISAIITVPAFIQILGSADGRILFWIYFFGVLWGIGNLTFGLTMRFLGLSLGMSIIMSLTSALGALMPPIYRQFFTDDTTGTISSMLASTGGCLILAGVAFSLVGIGFCGWAGVIKEKEVDEEIKLASVKEFSLSKGAITALVSGVLSACFSYGIVAGKPLAQAALEHGSNPLFQNNVTYIMIMLGGLTTNGLWCIFLGKKNKSYGDFTNKKLPLTRNYLLAILAGLLWYLQFFFYGMGESKMHNDASSWVLHMSFIIVVSNCWGLYFKEWSGTSKFNRRVLLTGIIIILSSICVVGYGNYLS